MKSRIVTDLFPLFLPESGGPRSKGIHVSAIIRCIALETGVLDAKWGDDLSLSDVREITDPASILRMDIGIAWDEFYINQILSRYGVMGHPREMEYHGVYMSMDAEDLSVIVTVPELRYGVRVHEVKSTWKSTKNASDIAKQWIWLAQMKAYCIARGTNTAVLHVLYICGDYHFPITPQLKVWELEFTDAELEENWSLLADYKQERLAIEAAENDGMYKGGE